MCSSSANNKLFEASIFSFGTFFSFFIGTFWHFLSFFVHHLFLGGFDVLSAVSRANMRCLGRVIMHHDMIALCLSWHGPKSPRCLQAYWVSNLQWLQGFLHQQPTTRERFENLSWQQPVAFLAQGILAQASFHWSKSFLPHNVGRASLYLLSIRAFRFEW